MQSVVLFYIINSLDSQDNLTQRTIIKAEYKIQYATIRDNILYITFIISIGSTEKSLFSSYKNMLPVSMIKTYYKFN